MDKITIIEGADLKHLLAVMGVKDSSAYRLRVSQTGAGAVKVKVNEGTWTPALGEQEARA